MTQLPTTSPLLCKLPYMADSLPYFHTIAAQLPTTLILQSDSADQPETNGGVMQGRYDIITAAPQYWLERKHSQTTWHGDTPDELNQIQGSSFDVLHQWLEYLQQKNVDYTQCIVEEIPFCGGIIGYSSYDLAREYFNLENRATNDIAIPDMQFGFYSWAIIQDHKKKVSWLITYQDSTIQTENILKIIDSTDSLKKVNSGTPTNDSLVSNISHKEYIEKFSILKNYIQSGDCYQINFSQRFSVPLQADSRNLYCAMREVMPSPYSAFLPLLGSDSNNAIISLSPERFIQLDIANRVTAQPIKGTAARAQTPDADRDIAIALQKDPKNRAENLMIVDLLRNDLGKVCDIGSIGVSKLFEIQTFANVHHLVSTIHGKLGDEYNAADLFQACFPGGSITGAPKKRAMEIIEELEPTRRSIYCGSIAYFSAHGAMDSSITIRTVLLNDGVMHCWGGSGIVADSDGDEEYQESITKIQVLLDAANKNN